MGIATASWGTPSYTDGKLTAVLTISSFNITGLEPEDIAVVTSTNGATNNWSILTPSISDIIAAGTVTISAIPPPITNGSFKLQLNARTLMSDGSGTDNAPATAVRSTAVSVDNRGTAGNFTLLGTLSGFLASSRNYARYPRAATQRVPGGGNLSWITDGRHFYNFNPSTRRATGRQSETFTNVAAMARHGTGFVAMSLAGFLLRYTYSTSTRRLTRAAVGPTSITGINDAMSMSTDGTTIYLMVGPRIYTVDPTQLSVTLVGTSTDVGNGAITYHAADRKWYAYSNTTDKLFEINPTDASTVREIGPPNFGSTDTSGPNLINDLVSIDNTIYAMSGTRTLAQNIYTVSLGTTPYATWGSILYTMNTRVMRATATLTERVNGATSDFKVQRRIGTSGSYRWIDADGWTISFFGGTQSAISLTVEATPTSAVPAGTYRFAIVENAFGADKPGNEIYSGSQDVGAHVVRVATAAWTQETWDRSKNEMSAVLMFSGSAVTGLTENDFQILDSGDDPQMNWTFDTIPATATSGQRITIAVTPPANTFANYRIQLNSLSVMSDSSATNNAPVSDVITMPIGVDNTAASARAVWTDVQFLGESLVGVLTFNSDPVFQQSDVKVIDDAGAIQSDWTIRTVTVTPAIGEGIFIEATPPSGKTGAFRLSYQISGASIADSLDVDLQMVRNQQHEFSYLKTIDPAEPPAITEGINIYMAANQSRIYMLDQHDVVIYDNLGERVGDTTIRLAVTSYRGFEQVGNNYYGIDYERVLDKTLVIQWDTGAIVEPGQFACYRFGSFDSFNSDGIEVSTFRLDQDNDTENTAGVPGPDPPTTPQLLLSFGVPRINTAATITFGHASPRGIAWLSDLQRFASTGLGLENKTINDLFTDILTDPMAVPQQKVPYFFIYDTNGQVTNEVPITNVRLLPTGSDETGASNILDMTSFGRGIALLEQGTNAVKIYTNNFRYSPSLSFSLHADNENPIAIAWNGNAFVVYDANGNFYFYGEEIPAVRGIMRGERQYTAIFNEQETHYDIYRQMASEYEVLDIDFPMIQSSQFQPIDFQAEATISDQLKVVNLTPRYYTTDLKVNDILIPHNADRFIGETLSALPTGQQLAIEGIDRVGNNFIDLVCNEQ